jgi:hypothetical protein
VIKTEISEPGARRIFNCVWVSLFFASNYLWGGEEKKGLEEKRALFAGAACTWAPWERSKTVIKTERDEPDARSMWKSVCASLFLASKSLWGG